MIHAANDNTHSASRFDGTAALELDDDTNVALSDFVIAIARNQARIDHLRSTGAANDSTKH
jgi:hypothetical protein